MIELEDVDAGAVHVTVRREGDTAHVRVLTDHELPTTLAGTVATRLHAVDQGGSWPTTKFAVSFGTVGSDLVAAIGTSRGRCCLHGAAGPRARTGSNVTLLSG